jgi:pimeloyl-ACP methyl ester carboxylesterase
VRTSIRAGVGLGFCIVAVVIGWNANARRESDITQPWPSQVVGTAGRSHGLGAGPNASNAKLGFMTRTFLDSKGLQRDYIVFLPYHDADRVKPPVILFLNGFGENGSDGVMQIAQNFGLPVWQIKRRFPFVVVAPQCRRQKTWMPGDGEIEAALEILDAVGREHNTDPDRIYLTGVSSGGEATWRIASQFRDRFAAVVPLASDGAVSDCRRLAASIAETRLPLWFFYNGLDSHPGVAPFNRSMKDELLNCGASPIVTEYAVPGHNCWDTAYRTPALYAWLFEQRRGVNASQSGFHRVSLDHDLQNELWRSDGVESLKDNEGLVIAARAGRSGFVTTRRSYGSSSFHFDVRTEGHDSCEVVFLASLASSGEPKAGWKLVLEAPDRGTGGVVAIDNESWAGYINATAQRAWKVDEWNEVRIDSDRGRCSAVINGWKALDIHHGRFTGMGSFGILQAATKRGRTMIRNMRICESTLNAQVH